MVILSILIVIIYLWLLFNHPFKDGKNPDTYQHYLFQREMPGGEEQTEEKGKGDV